MAQGLWIRAPLLFRRKDRMGFKRAATLEIAGHTITLDAEDAQRVTARTWKTTHGDQYVTKFYHDIGIPRQPVYELLEHFIVEAPHNRFVELIKRDVANQFNFRRSNIRAR
jgi:hypothetical protein